MKNILLLTFIVLISNSVNAQTINTEEKNITGDELRHFKGQIKYLTGAYPEVAACGFKKGSKAGTLTIKAAKAVCERAAWTQKLPEGCTGRDFSNNCFNQYFTETVGFKKPTTEFKFCEAKQSFKWGENGACTAPIKQLDHGDPVEHLFYNNDYFIGEATVECNDGVLEIKSSKCDEREFLTANKIDKEKEQSYLDSVKEELDRMPPIPESEGAVCTASASHLTRYKNGCPIKKDKIVVAYSDAIYLTLCKNGQWLNPRFVSCTKDPEYDCKTNYDGYTGIAGDNEYSDGVTSVVTNNKLNLLSTSSFTSSSCINPFNGLNCKLVVTEDSGGSYNGSFGYAKSISSKECTGIFLYQKVNCSNNNYSSNIGICNINDNYRP